MIAPALALLLTAGDPCVPIVVDLPPDRATAAVYRDVARAEEAAGSLDAAAVAYREALRRDGTDERSRVALASICRRGAAARRFGEGVSRMKAHDWEGAAAAFADARAEGTDASAALLQGVSLLELGEDARAAEALAVAARDPRTRDAARFHQGLLALRAGSPSQAIEAFEDAADARALSPIAMQLARQARISGHLVVVASADVGRDSNPALEDRDPTADEAGGLGVVALFRPLGRWGPYLRGEGQLRRYQTREDLDFAGYDAAAGWQLGREPIGALAEYDFAVRTLGDRPYLTAHRALASGWLASGPVLWTATALVRFERFATDWDPLTGTLARGELRAAMPLGRPALLGLSYGAGRDWTDTNALSWFEHGPRANLQLLLGARLVLLAGAGATWRTADGYDATIGATRKDVTIDGAIAIEWDLRRGLFLRGGVASRLAHSNVEAYSYESWTPSLGVRYVFGR